MSGFELCSSGGASQSAAAASPPEVGDRRRCVKPPNVLRLAGDVPPLMMLHKLLSSGTKQ